MPPRYDFTKERVSSGGYLRKEFGGQMKIALCSGKVLMAQVGGQKRKFGIEIFTVVIPTP